MPIFDFKCPKCGEEKEKLVRTDAVVECVCGEPMQKQVGKMNFDLKGSGWFKDGYK